MSTVGDCIWLWGHEAGAHDPGTGPVEWGIPGPSRITPLEAACYLGIRNLIMVRYNGTPAMPYDQLMIPLRALDRVVWSVTGAMGEKSIAERDHILDLAAREPNVSGLIMDDFLNWDTGEPELSLEELRDLAERRQLPDRTLDLMMVLYSHQLDAPIAEHRALCNQVSFWVWHARDLDRLEADFARFESLTGDQQRFLGCYVWDHGGRAPMPLAAFQRQCEVGLRWLHEGRVAGLIFLPSCHCDLGLDTVEWLRGWIAEHASERLPSTGAPAPPFDVQPLLAAAGYRTDAARAAWLAPLVELHRHEEAQLRGAMRLTDEPATIFRPAPPSRRPRTEAH